MTLTSVAGVFSRYFIVGFFLPAFFTLVALAETVDKAFLPPVYEDAKRAAQIAILGGVALLAGLVLLGLSHVVLRLYEGYPLRARHSRFPAKQIYGVLMWRQRRRFEAAVQRTEDKRRSEAVRFDQRFKLDQRFPHDDPTLLLPTTFGNRKRAFERHSWRRWHLNIVGAGPHIESLLSAEEAQVLADVKGDVAFFLNGSLLAILTGLILSADRIAHDHPPVWFLDVLICLAPFVVSALAYWAATSAVLRWGSVVRASMDLHRRELYEKLGLRKPRNFSDERQLAWRLNATLLVGDHLPDGLAAEPAGDDGEPDDPASKQDGADE